MFSLIPLQLRMHTCYIPPPQILQRGTETTLQGLENAPCGSNMSNSSILQFCSLTLDQTVWVLPGYFESLRHLTLNAP